MTNNALQPTNYASLGGRLDALLESLPNDYSTCIVALRRTMWEEFPALTENRNPVVACLRSWTSAELEFVIQEYSGFSNAAIHMFLEARIRNHWPALTEEIIRNMDEEMGVLTGGIPHLELMRYGYRVELGIETDGLRYTAVTEDFIGRMNALFRNPDNAFLAGVLLAFEGTAVDEFRIVERILRCYKETVGGEIPADSLIGRYVAGHVIRESSDPKQDPEMDHYRGMVEAVGTNVAGGELRPLVRGFLSVCLELNRWWEDVAAETFRKRIRNQLMQHGNAAPDLYPILRRVCSRLSNDERRCLVPRVAAPRPS